MLPTMAFVVARRAAGNIWPAVQANAPSQGCAVEDEAELAKLFHTGEILRLVARSRRHRGTLLPSGDTADFLLKDQTLTALQGEMEVVGP